MPPRAPDELFDLDVAPSPRKRVAPAPTDDNGETPQSIHDSTVDDVLLPGFESTLSLAGIDMEYMTLTTLTWLKRAGSCFVTGKKPTSESDTVRELGLFLLAHDKNIPIKERSRVFREGGNTLEDALDELLHRVRLRDAATLFTGLTSYVAQETSTLVAPIPDDKAPSTPGNT
jgi:hypothetical protein